MPGSAEPRLVRSFPLREFPSKVFQGLRGLWPDENAHVCEILEIRVGLEGPRQAPVDLQPVRGVILPQHGVRLTRGVDDKEDLQLFHLG